MGLAYLRKWLLIKSSISISNGPGQIVSLYILLSHTQKPNPWGLPLLMGRALVHPKEYDIASVPHMYRGEMTHCKCVLEDAMTDG